MKKHCKSWNRNLKNCKEEKTMTFTEMVTRLERLEAENNCLKAELKKASINIDKLRAERGILLKIGN